MGVREYWLIEPVSQTATILTLDSGSYIEVAPIEAGAIRSRVLLGLRLTLDDAFEDVDVVPPGDGAA